jgi:acylphosphatase
MNLDTYSAFGAVLVGNVQNKGFRAVVKDSGNNHHLDGEVFNNSDDTVSVYYGGYNGNISEFFVDLRIKSAEIDVIFEITENIVLPDRLRLPRGFHIIDTDTIQEKERKFDIAIELVRDINTKLEKLEKLDKLDSIETLMVSMNDSLKKMAEK